MPTYEYECEACGHAFEQFQSIKAEPVKKCPSCGKKKVKRLLGTGAGFVFKGSGFYITDYRSDSYNKAAKAAESASGAAASGNGEAKPASADGSAAKPETKSDSKAEAKPAAKAEPKSQSKPEGKSESKSKRK
jgi:putative FmdB family regulatory protein